MSVEKYLKKFSELKRIRQPFENFYRDVSTYILPEKYKLHQAFGDVTQPRESNKDARNLMYDSTASNSLDLFSSSLVGFLTNPAVEWFKLEPLQDNLLEIDAVSKWFDEVSSVVLSVFNNPQSKFYNAIKMAASDLGAFGTSSILMNESKKPGVYLEFEAKSVKEIFIAEDSLGNVDSIYRSFKISYKQLAESFGEDSLSDASRAKFNHNPYELTDILHVMEPKTVKEFDPDAEGVDGFPFRSVYILQNEKHIIDEGSFSELPIAVGRWDVISDDVYGTPPSWKAMPDIKMVNQMWRRLLMAADKALEPPLQYPDDAFIRPINLSSRALNPYRASSNGNLQPILTVGNIPITFEMLTSTRNDIRNAFFVDQLQLVGGPQMTATETMARLDEKLRLMAPMAGRVQSELLGQIITFTFNFLFRRSVELDFESFAPFSRPPEILLEQSDFNIKYVTPINKAQKSGNAQNILAFISNILPLAQIDPKILDKINFDAIVSELASVMDVPTRIVRGDDRVTEMRGDVTRDELDEQRIQQQQQAEQMAQMQSMMAGLGGGE